MCIYIYTCAYTCMYVYIHLDHPRLIKDPLILKEYGRQFPEAACRRPPVSCSIPASPSCPWTRSSAARVVLRMFCDSSPLRWAEPPRAPSMYMYTYMCIFIYTHVYTCMYAYVSICTHMYVAIHISCIHVYIYNCIYMHIHLCVCIPVCINVLVYFIYSYTCIS